MQVHQIQSQNMSFGYNSALNAKLMNDLSKAKKNKAYFESIRNLCSITNQTELKLREADKKGMPELTDRLARIFLPVKVILTDIIDSLFPNYNYKAKELETYAEEVQERNLQDQEDHWLTALVKHMKEDLEDYDTQNMNNDIGPGGLLSTLLGSMMPGSTMVLTSIRTQPSEDVDKDTDVDNEENVQTTEENTNTASTTSKDQAELIKLGKERVSEYIPEGSALKGFAGLGGMKELKAELTDKVVDFLKDPEQAKQDAADYGTKLPKGVLLYGPPGCGKTTVVKHLSVEAGSPLLKLETGKLKTSYYHETSKNIDAAFEYAYSVAKPEKPVIMLIDDADSFFVARNERTTQFEGEEMTTFLNKIQEAPEKNVMVTLTTNKYDIMDPAIKRRFDTQVYVGLPDEEARISLLKFFFNKYGKSVSLANNDEAIKRLAKKLENFPISAIEDMVNDACDIPRREAKEARKLGKIIRREVTEADFNGVLNKIENQNKKIKEDIYKTNATRKPVGFSG